MSSRGCTLRAYRKQTMAAFTEVTWGNGSILLVGGGIATVMAVPRRDRGRHDRHLGRHQSAVAEPVADGRTDLPATPPRARWPRSSRPSGSPHRGVLHDRGDRLDTDLRGDRRARSAGDQADPVRRRHASHRRRHRDRAVLPRLPLRRLPHVAAGRQRSVRAIGRCGTTATSRRS